MIDRRMQRSQLKDISSWMTRLFPEPGDGSSRTIEGFKMFGTKNSSPTSTFYPVWRSQMRASKNFRKTNIPKQCHVCQSSRAARLAKMGTRKIRKTQQVSWSNDTSDIPSTGSPVSVVSRDFNRLSCPLPRPPSASISRGTRRLQRKRPTLKCRTVS